MRRAIGFAVALALVLVLAFEGGGYDVVIRQQVGIAVWALIALGLGTGVLPRSRLSQPAWTAVGGLAALALFTLLALNWTDSDERTTAELARVLQYLGLVVLAYLGLNRHTWQGAAAGLATAALVVPLFAVGSRLFPSTFVDDVAKTLGTDRLSYPLDYWNAVSCWGAMAIAIGLCVGAHAQRVVVRALALAAVPAAALAVYLTVSRFGTAAVAIALVSAFVISRNRWTVSLNALVAGGSSALVILVARGHDEIAHGTGDAGAGAVLTVLIAAAAVCAGAAALTALIGADRVRMPFRLARISVAATGVCVLLGAAVLHGPIKNAWDEFQDDSSAAGGGGTDTAQRLTSFGGTRHSIWTHAFDAYQEDPMRGTGPGTFEFYWNQHGEGSEFVRDAHSLYIEQLAELGIPGLLAVLTAFTGLLLAAFAARRRWIEDRDLAAGTGLIAAFAVFLAYSGIDWMWEMGAVGALAIGGIAVAGAGGLPRSAGLVLSPWVRSGVTVLALVALATQVPGLVSTQRTRASDEALAAGDTDRARQLADDAIQAESWAGSPYAMRALVEEQAGKPDQARNDLDEAIRHEPLNWRYQLQLARLDAVAGDSAGVQAALSRAQVLAPRSPYLVAGSPFLTGVHQLLSEQKQKR